jgi:hypothetical protein
MILKREFKDEVKCCVGKEFDYLVGQGVEARGLSCYGYVAMRT